MLDKMPGVRPVGIGETLHRPLAKLVMRADGDLANTAGGNLPMCAGLKAGIEGATHAVGQRRLERVRERRRVEEAESMEGEEETVGVERALNNLNTETAGTEEEATEQLEAVLWTEVVETGEGEEEGDWNQRALEALEFLTQDADPSGTTLVDARNGFNDLSRLAMLWTVRHRWPAGARFTFNCYRNWAQLLLRHPGEPSVRILSREGVTQGDPLSMVLYGITLVPLAKELRAADPGFLSPFYADDAAFDSSERQSAQLLKLLMKRGPD